MNDIEESEAAAVIDQFLFGVHKLTGNGRNLYGQKVHLAFYVPKTYGDNASTKMAGKVLSALKDIGEDIQLFINADDRGTLYTMLVFVP